MKYYGNSAVSYVKRYGVVNTVRRAVDTINTKLRYAGQKIYTSVNNFLQNQYTKIADVLKINNPNGGEYMRRSATQTHGSDVHPPGYYTVQKSDLFGPRTRIYQGRVYMVPGKYPNYRYVISHVQFVILGPLTLYGNLGYLGFAGRALGSVSWGIDFTSPLTGVVDLVFDYEGMSQPAYWDDINQSYGPWYGYDL